MTITLSANGMLEIPGAFRKADALTPGLRCDFERLAAGASRVRVEKEPSPASPDLVDWLLACPVKDWWVEADRSSSSVVNPRKRFAKLHPG